MPDGSYRGFSRDRQYNYEDAQSKTGDISDLVERLRVDDIPQSFPARTASLNYFMKHPATKGLLREFAWSIRQVAERQLLGDLKGSSWEVLSALYSRTLGFGKIAEVVTYEQLMFGLREGGRSSPLKCDDRGVPYFKGTSLKSKKTICAAFIDLFDRGLISRYPYSDGHTRHIIYSGIPIWALRVFLLGHFAPFSSKPAASDIPDEWSFLCLEVHRATRCFEMQTPSPDHVFWSLIDRDSREKIDGYEALLAKPAPLLPS